MLLYSASIEDLEIVCRFFVFQDTSAGPRRIQYPVRERRESRHDAQSASEKDGRRRELAMR